MEKEFIPYEQALELKKLGFNEPCLFCYRGEHDLYCHSLGGYLTDMLLKSNSDLDTYEINKTTQYWVSAPTYSQIFRWFREKHKLDSYVEDIFTLGTLCYIFVINGNEDTVLKHHAKNTYEEAQFDCLNELIKMVKEPNMFDEYGNLKDELK